MQITSVALLLASFASALPTTSLEITNIARSIVARAPPEAKANLKSVASSGTGCASNSAAFVIKDDAVLGFDSLVVDSTLPAVIKKCLVTIDLQVDPKWKYTINKVSQIRGYIDNASGSFKAIYTVNGTTSEVSTDIKSSSTSDGNFSIRLEQNGATSEYGGGISTIDISLALLRDTTRDGSVAVDSLDIGFGYSK
ncbi:hypothetical protein BU24DRAFT_455821 [Aaosphaeria arxii CBS 175.79]|uniref:Secreted protein n=1 Tax=Aaosphaeria arxii CBS 175.79 TaxID=1450172 RepID=A0A6A5X8U2_9PLEO|nr:uncharacterized protein BU24DRAFT_455821 [Aaosphaeria arxii CBS 175.79]KAF2009306.1 hypothetical protein BU24DRAFT_455821 [Aaosphaeria arxii CBS 175.79]